MSIEAVALFDLCRTRKDAENPLEAHTRFTVRGTVVKAFLGFKNVPRIILKADNRGMRVVECHCISDEVLLHAHPGETVTVEGNYICMEDSLTVVLEQCERIGDEAPLRRRATTKKNSAQNRRCLFCGCGEDDGRRIIELPQGAICESCVKSCFSSLKG